MASPRSTLFHYFQDSDASRMWEISPFSGRETVRANTGNLAEEWQDAIAGVQSTAPDEGLSLFWTLVKSPWNEASLIV